MIAVEKCAEVCPAEARKVIGQWMTIGEVLEEAKKDMVFYNRSGGGVTISGSEPMMQPNFVTHLLEELHRYGISTAIETSGYAKWSLFENILKFTDFVLFDIKHMNRDKHKEFTGVSNELILKNAKRISMATNNLIIRLPLIPGHNDSEENLRETAKFIKGLRKVKEIHLLPYHSLGESKFTAIGREYLLHRLSPRMMLIFMSVKDCWKVTDCQL